MQPKAKIWAGIGCLLLAGILAVAPSIGMPDWIDVPIINREVVPQPGSTVYLIYSEAVDMNTSEKLVMQSNRFWNSLEARQLKFLHLPESLAPDRLRSTANQVGLPALVIASIDGSVLLKTKLPQSIEELDQQVKIATGL